MCRITGFWDFSSECSYPLEDTVTRMRDTLHRGGPDDAGNFIDQDHRLAFGHRRLSIIDLTDSGHQPMQFKDLTIAYNGEVYNYQSVREDLEKQGYQFSSSSDTEVVLKAIHCWGMEAIHRFRGMFAFALWDSGAGELRLCVDRMGVKPLYWYYHNGLFLFASELKAFHEHPGFEKEIDEKVIPTFLRLGYIPPPHAIFKNTRKLRPGTFLKISKEGGIQEETWWSPLDVQQHENGEKPEEEELVEMLDEKLTESFNLRLVSDVPVGVFLSGGIDSSLVAAIIQKNHSNPLKTFTIGFEEDQYNEAAFAKKVADHLGTEHHEIYCGEQEMQDIVSELPEIFDEPFGDSSAIPTLLVSKLAKQHVKVSLSADGGDEIFGGYVRYHVAKSLFPRIKSLPAAVKNMTGNLLNSLSPDKLERLYTSIPGLKNYHNLNGKYMKFRNAFDSRDLLDFYKRSFSTISENELQQIVYSEDYLFAEDFELDRHCELSYLGIVDMMTYLPGDIMTKVDRATMAVGLEGREPLLDHTIAEFGITLSDGMKYRNGKGKYILRQILKKYIPEAFFDRPKQGFGVPVKKWLISSFDKDLKAMVQDKQFFEAMHLKQEGVKNSINRFLNNDTNIDPQFIWNLFTLYQWYQKWITGARRSISPLERGSNSA